MKFTIRLDGSPIHHNGTRVGQHGTRTDTGETVFVDYSDPHYKEFACTISKGVLEDMESDVEFIAFRDQSHDLYLFDAAEFFQVLEGNTDDDHYVVPPEKYGFDDQEVAVKLWNNLQLFEGQGEEFELKGGKYDELETLDA